MTLAYHTALLAARILAARTPELDVDTTDRARAGVDYLPTDRDPAEGAFIALLRDDEFAVGVAITYERGLWRGVVSDADGHELMCDLTGAHDHEAWSAELADHMSQLLAR